MTRKTPMPPVALLIALAIAVSGCGQTAKLTPKPGRELPVAPAGRDTRPTAEELLKLKPQAAPQRSVELRQRSEDREDDPYDLPPEG